MACASQVVVSVPVMVKLNKISSYLSSFQVEKLPFRRNSLHKENVDEQPDGNSCIEENSAILPQQQDDMVTACPSPTSDKINVYYCSDVEVSSKQSLSTLRCRLKTFGDVSWLLPINILSVYECVRRGWYLLQHDMLCCCCCNEMVCLQLPPSHSSSYKHAVSILCDRVLSKHRGNCRFLSCPDPVSVCRPPSLLTMPHLYSLAAAAHQLVSLAPSTGAGTRLPHLKNGGKNVMDRLGVSSSLLQVVWGSVCDNEWQHVAVLLVLCGWKATSAADTIKCELCQRSIGLWHFLSYAEHQEREAALAATAAMEIEQTTTEAAVLSTQSFEGMTENTEDMSQKTGDESSVAEPNNELLVARPTERGDSIVNKAAEEGSDTTENSYLAESIDVSGDPSQGVETENNVGSRQISISDKDQANNSSPVTESEVESGNKRKRSECEDQSSEKHQSILTDEGCDEGSDALPSKRSKSSDDDQQSPDVIEPLPASPAVQQSPDVLEPLPASPAVQQSTDVIEPLPASPAVQQSSDVIEPLPASPAVQQSPDVIEPLPASPAIQQSSDVIEPLPASPVVQQSPDVIEPLPASPAVQQSPDVIEPLLASPAVLGEKSSMSDLPQVSSKPLFCPFSQHRFWCSWITSEKKHLMTNSGIVACTTDPSNGNTAIDGTGHDPHAGVAITLAHSADRGEAGHGNATGPSGNVPLDTLPGYSVFGRQLKSVLQLSQRRQWTTSEKYSNTIDGLRNVRAHLNSWAK